MTIDEAIKELELICPKRPQKLWSVKRKEAVAMAIKALKNMKIMCSFDRDSEEYDCD